MDSGTYSTVRTNGKAKEVDSAGSDKLVQVLPGKMGECRKVNSALESVLEPPELYSTYKEFIDAHVADWPEYRWMQLFLEQKGKDPSDTSVTVFDSMHGSLVEHDYSSRISSLPHFLRQRPPEVRTRLIIVTHFESWAIDRNVVDTLGKSFDIDPQFFHKHFHTPDNYDMSCERGFPKNHWGMLTSDWTRPLPSESPVLEIGGKDEDHLSAGVYKHGSASSQSHSTILVWLRIKSTCKAGASGFERATIRNTATSRPFSCHGTLAGRYKATLRKFTSGDVTAADRDPLYYVLPYARFFLLEYWHEFENELSIDAYLNFSDHDEYIDLHRVRHLHRQLLVSHKSISRFRGMKKKRTMLPAISKSAVLNDMMVLASDLRTAEVYYKEISTDKLHDEQLNEAIKSKSAAISVGRLSKLAFVFIPLSLTTSFFGMNLVELGTGHARLWEVLVTAVLVLFISVAPISGHIWVKVRPYILCNPQHLRFTMHLAWFSPSVAFWFAMFCLFHSVETNRRFCDQGITWYLANGKKSRDEPYNRISNDRLWYLNGTYGEGMQYVSFWRSRANFVLDFIQAPGWDDHSFLDRMMSAMRWSKRIEESEP